MLKSSNEALMTFTNELKRIKKVIVAAVMTSEESMEATRLNSEAATGGANSIGRVGPATATNSGGASADPAAIVGQTNTNYNMDVLLKRLMKFKHLEDDNKKLKNLLK